MLDSLSVYRVIERQGQVGDTEMERRSLTPKPGGGGGGVRNFNAADKTKTTDRDNAWFPEDISNKGV